MNLENLTPYRAFCGVAQHGNFAKAAKALGLPVSQVSKRVSKLEEALGIRLFHRSTRAVSLTDEGLALLPRVKAVLEEMENIEATYSAQKELSGTVKITAVPFMAQHLLIPLIQDFQVLHPKVKIELLLSEKMLNLIEDNIDLALRIQTPADTELIYRKLFPNDLVFCASPAYLKMHGRPKHPEDLAKHQLLFLKFLESCSFKGTELKLKKFAHAKKVECDSGVFLKELALKDFGILVRSVWDVKPDLKAGTLIQVLKDHPLEPFGHVHLVIPSRKLLAPRSRAFYEFVLERSKQWK